MFTLGIDIETYSSVDIKKSGLYKYVESPDFEILMIGYSINGREPIVVDMSKGDRPNDEFYLAYHSDQYLKTAWNAAFEIACFNKYFEFQTTPDKWECTMIKTSMLGYPMSLDTAAKAMKLPVEKMTIQGKALIKFFSVPAKDGTRNMPKANPAKWIAYKDYNKMDVVVEQKISQKISFFKITDRERKFWLLDQKINATGVMLDRTLFTSAININNATDERLLEAAKKITGLPNPNSTAQLKKWIEDKTGTTILNLQKESIKELIKEHTDPDIVRILKLRQEMSKSSIKKYKVMEYCTCQDDRARGLFQFYGANKTGRWSGRLIQVQNLTKHKIEDLDLARDIVKSNDVEVLRMVYGNVPDIMSQIIRSAFIAPPGKMLLPSDFSAIEARVTAWFANEKWKIDVFKGHGKIYEAAGSQMFNVPMEAIVGDLRAKAKVAELALGYQGSVNALEKMGALKMGLKLEELKPLVDLWRKANPATVRLWYAVDKAAITAVQNPGEVVKIDKLTFTMRHNTLFIQLPSGRFLSYVNPHLVENRFGKTSIAFWGVDQITKKWCKQETYGGKLVENIVQGCSRDILADAMLRLNNIGYTIVMHVHDEIVFEVNENNASEDLKLIDNVMAEEISWAKGLPLKAQSFISPYYRK